MEQFLISREQLQFVVNTMTKMSLKYVFPLKFSNAIMSIVSNVQPPKIKEEDHYKLQAELIKLKEECASLKKDLETFKNQPAALITPVAQEAPVLHPNPAVHANRLARRRNAATVSV